LCNFVLLKWPGKNDGKEEGSLFERFSKGFQTTKEISNIVEIERDENLRKTQTTSVRTQ